MNVLNLVTKTLNEKQSQPSDLLKNKPPRAPVDLVREALEGSRTTIAKTVTPQTFATIREQSNFNPSNVSGVKEIQRRQDADYAKLVRYANERPSITFQRHLDTLSADVLAGRAVGDGWSESELIAERNTILESQKRALYSLTLEGHALAMPIFDEALKVVREIKQTEFQSEAARHERYGIPMEGMSEFLSTLVAAENYIQIRRVRPVRWCPMRTLLQNLVEL